MKEAVGGVSIFQIVILFILLFTAIMCLTINNANAFQIKDEITNIIELSDGDFLTNDAGTTKLNDSLVNAIAQSSYRTTGKCDQGYIGYDRNGIQVGSGERASICIKCINVTGDVDNFLKGKLGDNKVAPQGVVHGFYYQVVVFYQLDLPIISQAYDFKTKGETMILYNDAGFCKQGNDRQ